MFVCDCKVNSMPRRDACFTILVGFVLQADILRVSTSLVEIVFLIVLKNPFA